MCPPPLIIIDLSNELFNTSFELNEYIDDISPNSVDEDRNSFFDTHMRVRKRVCMLYVYVYARLCLCVCFRAKDSR